MSIVLRLLYVVATPILFVPMFFAGPPAAGVIWAFTGHFPESSCACLLEYWLNLGAWLSDE